MTIYDKSGQRIFFCRETTYGKPYDPETALSAFTITAADYPHWRRFDKITEGTDIVVPLVEKLKQFDLADGKHASAIFSGNIEPQEFTIPVNAQTLEFLVLALTGNTSNNEVALTSHDRKITQVLTFSTAQPTQGDYFLFDIINGSDVVEHYALWSDTANDNTTGKPTITGINATRVLSVNTSGPPADTTALADAVQAELEGITGVTTAVNAANVITVVVDNAGAVQPARDSGASTAFDVAVSVTTFGATQYAIPEAVDTTTPSFTMHVEQRNATTAEDIVWDLFGCVIDSIEVDVNFGDKITKANITFKCPYALENTNGRCTNEPPKKQIDAFPTMLALKESAGNYLIMDSTTDRTPDTVDKVVLRIKNNITFLSDVGTRYMTLAATGKREIEMNVVGCTSEKELFTFYQGVYVASGTDWKPTSSTGLLNTVFKLQRDATYDYLMISIRNWLIQEHNFHFVDVDEAVKSVDMTFEDSTGDSNGRIIDDCDFISAIDETIMIV